MIDISTLGRGVIHCDGVPDEEIPPQSQKCALLLFLAMEGPVTRGQLLKLFWPDRERGKARHALSQALYALRREFGEDCLEISGDRVGLKPEAVRLDAKELETAQAEGAWETVLQLYQGPFLERFALPGAPEFESWCAQTRARLSGTVNQAFARVLERQMEADDLSGALATASRWVELKPLEDEARHALITLLAQSGKRAQALEQFENYRARLARELGAEPLEDTKKLVERIRGGERPHFEPLAVVGRRDSRTSEAVPSAYADVGAPAQVGQRDARWRERPSRRGLLWTTGALYLAAVWVAIQLADTLVDRGILSDWVFTFVLVAAIVGFPITLTVAWYKGTELRLPIPDAGRRQDRGPLLARARRIVGPALAVLVALIIGLLAEYLADRWLPGRGADSGGAPAAAEVELDPTRIAILPFRDVSLEQEFGRLTLGLTEHLITELNRHDELTVPPLSAVQPLLQAGATLDSLARYLRAGTLVDGNISASLAEIRLDVSLIDPVSLAPMASETVVQAKGELTALRDRLLEEVSRILSTELGLSLRDRERRASTESDEAWELYLEARQAAVEAKELRSESPEAALRGYRRSDSLLAAAEDLDPDWIVPILERGWVAGSLARLQGKSPRIRDPGFLRLGIDHAERVLEDEPQNANALELRGTLRYWLLPTTDDATEAASLLRGSADDLATAVNLNPKSAHAWHRLSDVYRKRARFEKAKEAAEQAYAADEFYEERQKIFERLCHVSLELREWSEVTRWCDEAREAYPENRSIMNTILVAFAGPEGPEPDVDLAWSLRTELIRLTPADELDSVAPPSLLWVAGALARAGYPDSARAVIRQAHALSGNADPMLDYYEANVRLQLGERDTALNLLHKYIDVLPAEKAYIAGDWWWESLRDHPGWSTLVS